MTTLPLLYSFRRCPYAMRARLAIKASGQKVELRELILANKPEHMLEISPKGTVPVLLLSNGEVIDESLDIAKWALKLSDPLNLLPIDDKSETEINQLIATNDGPFKHHLDRTKYPNRYPDENPEENRDKANIILRELNNRLSGQTYLTGNKQTLADLMTAPFVRQFAHIDKERFMAEPWPNLIRWLNEFLESDLFQSVMEKYQPWQVGDPPLMFG